MAGEFGAFINTKRKARNPDGSDILLRDIAEAMGNMSVTYLSDIIKGRRNPPEIKLLETIAAKLSLSPEEKAEMFDLAGREREEAAPDLPSYIMDENIPHVRAALRKANDKGLGDDFWKKVMDDIDKKE
jgi:transcriptional regulator with XRE-family HTH domain